MNVRDFVIYGYGEI